MTEAELWQLFFAANERVGDTFSGLLSVTFAYLATAYFIGKRLSSFQTLVVSFLYVYAAGLLAVSSATLLNRQLEFRVLLLELNPSRFFLLDTGFLWIYTVLLVMSIPVSLFFMWQIRRNPELGAGLSGRDSP